jgi:hypothetical protein
MKRINSKCIFIDCYGMWYIQLSLGFKVLMKCFRMLVYWGKSFFLYPLPKLCVRACVYLYIEGSLNK